MTVGRRASGAPSRSWSKDKKDELCLGATIISHDSLKSINRCSPFSGAKYPLTVIFDRMWRATTPPPHHVRFAVRVVALVVEHVAAFAISLRRDRSRNWLGRAHRMLFRTEEEGPVEVTGWSCCRGGCCLFEVGTCSNPVCFLSTR